MLKEYLEDREKEVVSIMMSLYDEEEVIRSYIKSERYEAAQEAEQKKAKEKASLMLKNGKITMEEMPIFSRSYLVKKSVKLKLMLCNWCKQIQ